jgi:ribosomal protein S18 acetylase RimI-like enzyme
MIFWNYIKMNEKTCDGIFDIIVAKNERGAGYGQEIMTGILNAANHEKVKKAYLSVVVGNVSAENLYQKLGFTEIYRYWYRKKSNLSPRLKIIVAATRSVL